MEMDSFVEKIMLLQDQIPQIVQAMSIQPANEETEDQMEFYEEISLQKFMDEYVGTAT